jgi:catechol-2,3-dioxygenase
MRFRDITLASSNLVAQKSFYGDLLGLPLLVDSPDQLTTQTGKTKLTFLLAPEKPANVYHIAFNVPENQLPAAGAWIELRTPVLASISNPTKTVFEFLSWNAHSIYFKDGNGNILEFIARHNLENASDVPFTSDNILEVSEIGLPTENVALTASELETNLNLPLYDGRGSQTFAAIGDEHGLLIIVPLGHPWLPTNSTSAAPMPIQIGSPDITTDYSVTDLPYDLVHSE